MLYEMIFAGFGGQGVLSMGKLIAYSAMIEGKEVSWMPSYGPEMRGGTANCITIVSDTQISSPIISQYDIVTVLNLPSYQKFEPKVKPGGLLIVESTNIDLKSKRDDIDIIYIPAGEESVKLDNTKIMNMILLGALIHKTNPVKIETILESLKKVLPKRHHHLIGLNETALNKGIELAK